MGKSKPGVCDICGCAVLRFEDGDFITIQQFDGFTDCFCETPATKVVRTKVVIPERGQVTVNGHTYQDKKLIKVRCAQHQDAFSARPDFDAKGGTCKNPSF